MLLHGYPSACSSRGAWVWLRSALRYDTMTIQSWDGTYDGLLGCNSTWLTAGVVLKRESAKSFSRFLMAKLETPMFFTRPDAGSF